jgi:hypothetical protein
MNNFNQILSLTQKTVLARIQVEIKNGSVGYIAPPGWGKTTISAAVVLKQLEDYPRSRILIILPAKALQEHYISFIQEYRDKKINTQIVDNRYLTLMLDKVKPGESLWAEGTISLLTSHYLKNKKIKESLLTPEWDMVIIDDIDSYSINNIKYFEKFILAETPVLFFGGSGEVLTSKLSNTLSGKVHYIIEDRNLSPFELKLHPIKYKETIAEIRIRTLLKEVAERVRKMPTGDMVEKFIITSFESSPIALGAVLQDQIEFWKPIRNKLAHSLQLLMSDISVDGRQIENIVGDQSLLRDLDPDSPPDLSLDILELNIHLKQLEDLRNLGYNLEVDSKLDAFLQFYKDVITDTKTGIHIVLTRYKPTATYLVGSLEELSPSVQEFTLSDENDIISPIDGQNRFFVLTWDSIKKLFGVEKSIDSLFVYDMPLEKGLMPRQYNLLSRFKNTKAPDFLKTNYLEIERDQ